MRNHVFVMFVVMLGSVVVAQRPTFRERIAVEQTDVALSVNVDGPRVVFEDILKATNLAVHRLLFVCAVLLLGTLGA